MNGSAIMILTLFGLMALYGLIYITVQSIHFLKNPLDYWERKMYEHVRYKETHIMLYNEYKEWAKERDRIQKKINKYKEK